MSADPTFDRYLEGERPADFMTLSGIELSPLYGPEGPPMAERPGEYPFHARHSP